MKTLNLTTGTMSERVNAEQALRAQFSLDESYMKDAIREGMTAEEAARAWLVSYQEQGIYDGDDGPLPYVDDLEAAAALWANWL